MSRSARPADSTRRNTRRNGVLGRLAGLAAANPLAAGGLTAFAVAFVFINANALWYQPHAHGNALLATREPVRQPPAAQQGERRETTIRIERAEEEEELRTVAIEPEAAPKPTATTASTPPPVPQQPAASPAGDPMVRSVQAALAVLGVHQGDVDGLMGPQTRTSIVNYRRIAGLDPEGGIDPGLLAALGLESGQTTAAVPSAPPVPATPPVPTTRAEAAAPAPPPAAPAPAVAPAPTVPPAGPAAAQPDPKIVRIQAGLRAFGNDDIALDGVAGPRTRAAIREFQSLFGLEETGEPDERLLAKMGEIGLTN